MIWLNCLIMEGKEIVALIGLKCLELKIKNLSKETGRHSEQIAVRVCSSC